jgi:hypothetical protein
VVSVVPKVRNSFKNLKSIAMKFVSLTRMKLYALTVSASFILFSCQKEGSKQPVSEQDAAVYSEESTQAEASFDDVTDIGMTAADEESVAAAPNGRYLPLFEILRLRIGASATITVSPNDETYPKTITIDFGDGSDCKDGKWRKGAIVLHLTGPIRRPGSVLTVTFRDFYLNRAHIEGTKVISNLSENGAVKFTVQVSGGKLTYPNGRGYTYEALKYYNQVEGADTKTCLDDVYHIEGRSKTQFANGTTIVLNTETALVKKLACPWISKGLLKININDFVLLLDFGAPNEGDCDNKALLTWNNGGSEKLITLP